MTSILRRIDSFMFDRVFQPIVDRFPDQGPVGVAKFIIMGAAVFFVASGALDGVLGHYWLASFTAWWLLVCVGCHLVAGAGVQRLGLRNVYRLSRYSDRGFAWALLALALTSFVAGLFDDKATPTEQLDVRLFNAAIVLRWAYEYAVACDVRPPKARKASMWSSLLRSARQGA